MHEPRARVEAEALEPNRPRGRLEGLGIVVRHGDVTGDALEVLGGVRAANGAVVLGTAVGRADDQRFAKPIAQRLQLVERGPPSAAACRSRGRRSRRARSSASARQPQAHRASGNRRSWRSSRNKKARRGAGRDGCESGSDQGLGPNHRSFMAMPVRSAISTPVVMTCTAVCTAVPQRKPAQAVATVTMVARLGRMLDPRIRGRGRFFSIFFTNGHARFGVEALQEANSPLPVRRFRRTTF